MDNIRKNKLSPFSLHARLTVSLFLALAIAFVGYALSEKQIDRANDRRHQSFLLADELRQSSDDLTRMARTYAVTRDPLYKKHYQDILDIRDGKKPRPAHYQHVYWDLARTGPSPAPGNQAAVALLDLMQQAGITEGELQKLAQAKANADRLTATEFKAMKLAETTGPAAEASRAQALMMLFDDNYYQAKAAIMRPSDEFYALMGKRTLDAVQAAQIRATVFRIVFITIGLGLLLMLLRTYKALHTALGGSVADVHAHITRMGGGDFSTPIPNTDAMKDSVLGWLAAMQINLGNLDRQRKADTAALAFATEMLERTSELAKVGGWELDVPTMKRSWSQATFHIHELDSSEVPTIDEAIAFYPAEARPVLRAAMQAAIGSGTPYDLELPLITAKGRPIWVRTQGHVVMKDGQPIKLIGAFHDITERKQAERHERFRSHTLELLAGGKPLPDTLEAIVRGVEQLNPAMFCSILLLDATHKRFINCVAPSLPDFYNAAMHGIAIGMGVGSCGTAAFTGERVIVEDIATHPYWVSYRELAARAGLRACWSQPVRASSGEVLGTFAIYHHEAHTPAESDIYLIEQSAHLASIAIERSQVQASLVRTAEMLERTGSLAKVGGWEASPTEQFWSLETCRIYDINPPLTPPLAQALGFHTPEVRRTIRAALRAGIDNGTPWDMEVPAITAKGRPIWVRFQGGALMEDGKVVRLFGTCQDISERKTAEDEIEYLAFYDSLTHLPNRRLLLDRLGIAIAASVRHQRKGALLFIDMDNFKTINDTLGHKQGDLLLEQVARRLSACIREDDTVARLGGDEFVVMLGDLSENMLEAASQAEVVGEKIIAILGQPYLLANGPLRSTPSIGITLFGDQQESTDDLLKRADLAMYQAKAAGRNTLRFFDPQMQAVVTAHAALETDLREAVQEQQFLLYYQAQVDGEGQLTGVEALVRWHHPQRGLVPPAEFIPLAEDTGLILPLGHWVLEAACKQLAIWAARPALAPLSIAVNVSPRQFHQPDFVDQVLTLLERTGANPKKLKLELTESLLIDNIENVITKMTALKARGVCFSLDDFGTGYSSLAYLKRLPLDQLKIDQGFVRDILIDPNDAAIAKMIVMLAESLGLGVIAEGVETEAQRSFLADHGCPAYQGYLFSRPLPIKEFEAFAARA